MMVRVAVGLESSGHSLDGERREVIWLSMATLWACQVHGWLDRSWVRRWKHSLEKEVLLASKNNFLLAPNPTILWSVPCLLLCHCQFSKDDYFLTKQQINYLGQKKLPAVVSI